MMVCLIDYAWVANLFGYALVNEIFEVFFREAKIEMACDTVIFYGVQDSLIFCRFPYLDFFPLLGQCCL